MTQYIALLHRTGRKGYGVSFPDFPGCVSVGTTIENALKEATEALALHVDGMHEDGDKIPKPRGLDAIRQAKQDWVELKDAVIATVPILPPQGNPCVSRSLLMSGCWLVSTPSPRTAARFWPRPRGRFLKRVSASAVRVWYK